MLRTGRVFEGATQALHQLPRQVQAQARAGQGLRAGAAVILAEELLLVGPASPAEGVGYAHGQAGLALLFCRR